MHVFPSEALTDRAIETTLHRGTSDGTSSNRTALDILPLMAVLTAFWIYVTLSNVLYAHSMQASLGAMSSQHLFAPWLPRVMQHLFLYPVLIGCIWASLHIGWQPAWRKGPAQLLLGLVFSVLGAPALFTGELILGTPGGPTHQWPLSAAEFLTAVEPSMWLASATNFLLTYGFGLALITGLALYQRFRDSEFVGGICVTRCDSSAEPGNSTRAHQQDVGRGTGQPQIRGHRLHRLSQRSGNAARYGPEGLAVRNRRLLRRGHRQSHPAHVYQPSGLPVFG